MCNMLIIKKINRKTFLNVNKSYTNTFLNYSK